MHHTCKNNFPWHKNQKHNPWLHHTVDQTRKQLRFIAWNITDQLQYKWYFISLISLQNRTSYLGKPAKLLVSQNQALQPYGETHITTANHVLNLEVEKLGWEAKLLYHAGILSCSKARLLLAGDEKQGEKHYWDEMLVRSTWQRITLIGCNQTHCIIMSSGTSCLPITTFAILDVWDESF